MHSQVSAMDKPVGIRLAVVGTRTFTDYPVLCKALDAVRTKHAVEKIVSGGARGADRLAERYAKENGIPMQIKVPDWKTHGKRAGLLRNTDIVNACDVLCAFWDGKSRGTQDSIDKAKKAGKVVIVIM